MNFLEYDDRVKISTYNEIENGKFIKSSEERYDLLHKMLDERNIDNSKFKSIGDKINVGCGQMAAKKLERIKKNMITIKSIETLKTNRLNLRRFCIDDAEALFNNWGTDKEISKYMLWKNYKTLDDAVNSINYYIECYENNSNFRQYAIELNDTNELIGQISFTISKKHESAEIAYLIARPYQNKGFMKEALIAIVDYLINSLNCTRISAEVMIENISSIKLLEKNGFVQEGIEKLKYKKKDGKFTDIIVMSLIDDKRL